LEVKPFGPLQEYVTLGVIELAVMVKEVTAQVKVPPVAEAPGGEMLLVTVVEAVAVQPFVLFVTFIVYVPAALTIGVKVVAPETMLPPLEAVHK
jgi:hypothetical protein